MSKTIGERIRAASDDNGLDLYRLVGKTYLKKLSADELTGITARHITVETLVPSQNAAAYILNGDIILSIEEVLGIFEQE